MAGCRETFVIVPYDLIQVAHHRSVVCLKIAANLLMQQGIKVHPPLLSSFCKHLQLISSFIPIPFTTSHYCGLRPISRLVLDTATRVHHDSWSRALFQTSGIAKLKTCERKSHRKPWDWEEKTVCQPSYRLLALGARRFRDGHTRCRKLAGTRSNTNRNVGDHR